MKIFCTEDKTSWLQCRGCTKNCNCDGTSTKNKLYSSKATARRSYRSKRTMFYITVALFALISSAQGAKDQPKCPRYCSCQVETIVFCNNKGLLRTPTDFTSSVEKLYLFNNNISSILPATLRPLRNLKILDVSGNRLTDVALWDGIFTQLTLLENLMLQNNRIARVNKGMFKGLRNLARIYLHENLISTIEPGSFDNLPNLVELKLRKNRIVLFPKLHHTPNLLLLDLGNNKIRTIRDMAFSTVNVEQLLLQNNRLTELRSAVFDDTSKLTHLDISNNRLTAVPQVIKSLVSLRTLNMSLNRMDTIPRGTFDKLKSLKSLYLRGMGLKTLPEGIITPNKIILNNADLTENDWDCKCGMRWLSSYIRIFKDAFVNPEDIQCSASSKNHGRTIMDLEERDFECTKDELNTIDPPPGDSSSTSAPSTTSRGRDVWKANPCDVFQCANGGSCVVVGFHPICRCAENWTGTLCRTEITTAKTTLSTTTTTTTTRATTTVSHTPPPPQRPQLMINPNSVTEHTAEIILPTRNTELVLSIAEIGVRRPPKEFSIMPEAQPFTVKNLESGRSYNICIHLHLPGGSNSRRKSSQTPKDTLCGSVTTKGVKVASIPASKPEITVVPSPGVTTKIVETPVQKETTVITKKVSTNYPENGIDEKLYGEKSNPKTVPTEAGEFKMLYPAIGAGIGAVVVIIVIVMFCICRRQKRLLKLKQQNGPDYIPATPVDNHNNEVEMATVVHHHHHNHYNAGSIGESPSRSNQNSPSSNTQDGAPKQNGFSNPKLSPAKVNANNNNHSSVALQSKSSRSSSRSSGISQPETRYTSIQPQQPHMPAVVNSIQKYDSHTQNGIPNGYNMYRGHEAIQENAIRQPPHCQVPPRPQNLRMTNDTQPLLTSPNSYYGANDSLRYPVSPMNVTPYNMPPNGAVTYSPLSHNAHAMFQPIQSPTVMSTTPGETIPNLTHRLSSSHVLPASAACLNRNLVNENMQRYHEGVQVV